MLTKGAIGNLINRYRAVLKKCHLLNTFGSLAVASMLVLGGAGVAEAVATIEGGEENDRKELKILNSTHPIYSNYKDPGYLGGVFYVKSGFAIGSNLTFNNNSVDRYGGAINNAANLYLSNCQFNNNSGLYTSNKYSPPSAQKSNGGAIYNTGALTIEDGSFVGNKAITTYKTATGSIVEGFGGAIGNRGTLTIKSNTPVDLENFTGGVLFKANRSYSSGAVDLYGNHASITNVRFENNRATYGGAIKITSGTADFESVAFKDNVASGQGGAVYIYKSSGDINFENTRFTNNSGQGGAIYISKDFSYEVNFKGNNIFSKNHTSTTITETTGNDGTPIYTASQGIPNDIYNSGTINVKSGKTTLNSGMVQNGGKTTVASGAELYIASGEFKNSTARAFTNKGTLTISNAVFSENSAANYGGAIHNSGVTVSVDNSLFKYNGIFRSGGDAWGGAVFNEAGSIFNISNSEFVINYTRSVDSPGKPGKPRSGAIRNNGQMTITNTIFDGNATIHSAQDAIGGAYHGAGNSILIASDTTFRNNFSSGDGGAVYLNGADVDFSGINSFAGNIAGKYGGAMRVENSTLDFAGKNTFTSNTAASSGGALSIAYSSVVTFSGENEFKDNRIGVTISEVLNADGYPVYTATGGTPNDIHNEGTIKVLAGTTTLYGGITGKASIDVAEGAALVIDTVEAGTMPLEGAIALTGNGDITLKAKQSLLDGAVDHSISGKNITLESADGQIIHSDDSDRIIKATGNVSLTAHKDDVIYTANGNDDVAAPNAPAQIEISGFQKLAMSTEDGYAIGNNGGNVAISGGDVEITSGNRSAVANYSVHSGEFCTTDIEASGDVTITAKGDVAKSGAKYNSAVYAQTGSISISGNNVTIADELNSSEDTFAVHANGGSISLDAKNALEVIGKVKVEGNGALTIGGSNGSMTADSIEVADGTATLKKVKASLKDVTASGGKLELSETDIALDKLSISAGAVNVYDSELVIGELTAKGGSFFADPSTVIIKELAGNELGTATTIGADTAVVIGGSSIDGAVPGTSGYAEGMAALVLGKPITLSGEGGILVDPQAASGTAVDAGTAIFADGSLLAVNASDAATGAVITGNGSGKLEAKGQAKLYVADAATNQTYRIAEKFTEANVADTAWSLEHGTLIINSLLDVDIDQNKLADGTVELVTTTKVNEDSAFFDAIPTNALHELADAGLDVDVDNAGSVPAGKKFLSRAAESTAIGYTSSVDEGVAMVNEVSRAAVTAGVQNTSLRIADAASNTVVDHMSLSQHGASSSIHADGVDFWAAPMYGNLYTSGMVTSGSSVRGQFGGLALGADLEAGQFLGGKFRLGAAINGGGGQSETKGNVTSTQNDYDFGGINFYAGWNSGALNIIGSVGYGFGNHEVEMGLPSSMGMGSAKADIDTTVFTADLRAEYQIKTDWVDFLPHAGVRYTALRTSAHDLTVGGDVLNSVERDTQNIVQFPIGVTLSKDFSFADWNVKPMVDVSVIPAAGDKEATTKVNFSGLDAWDSVNTRIMDSTSWSGTVGIQAEKGSMTFGLNYGVQASSNETDQNVQVKFGWKF